VGGGAVREVATLIFCALEGVFSEKRPSLSFVPLVASTERLRECCWTTLHLLQLASEREQRVESDLGTSSSSVSFLVPPRSLTMSFRCARSLLQTAQQPLPGSAARAFSSSPIASASSSKILSPLNKTAIARRERAARGAGNGGKRGSEKQVLTLDEAAKVLQVRPPSLSSPSFEGSSLSSSYSPGLPLPRTPLTKLTSSPNPQPRSNSTPSVAVSSSPTPAPPTPNPPSSSSSPPVRPLKPLAQREPTSSAVKS
jgi:hypothetical protein